MKTIICERDAIYRGDLILVNKQHPIHPHVSFEQELVAVDERQQPAVLLNIRARTALCRLFAHLQSEQQIVAVSGYRSLQEQQQIYADSIRDNGLAFTQTYVALPNCSEHQTGLAIDLGENRPQIDFIRPDFPYTGICQAFREQAAAYGFIERYPEGKEAITGIGWEPWHFRYVGVPHAQIIQERGLTLEEYTDYVKAYTRYGEHLFVETNNGLACIYYVPLADGNTATIDLPDDSTWQISGNNRDGLVVTVWTATP
ncbi:M15 family metallopeptidase [Brevibacillus sp. TJ4]|uniref:M15 family metallopeptidase n=1 Tax=Brevibacillus sp. TJ4 TaxID=3234853 RepID=UPI003BA0B788